jgi:cytochrome P450
MLDPGVWDPARVVYIPFGAGPRGCIGFRFSLVEMQVILTMFASAFRVELLSPVPVLPSPQFTLKAAAPVRLRLLPR